MDVHSTITKIAQEFFPLSEVRTIQRLSVGHIHETYVIEVAESNESKKWLLQRFSTAVFTNPEAVANNTKYICDQLAGSAYPFEIAVPQYTQNNQPFAIEIISEHETRHWRMFSFLENGTTYWIIQVVFVQ